MKAINLVAVALALSAPALALDASDLPFDPESFDLLPLREMNRQVIYAEHRAAFDRLRQLGNKAKKLKGELAKQGRGNEKRAGELRDGLEKVAEAMRPHLEEIRATLDEEGIEAEVFARTAAFPLNRLIDG